MTVGESIRRQIDEAGGEIITYFKILSTGEFGITRLTPDNEHYYNRDYYMLDENNVPVIDYKLCEILMGTDQSESYESPYRMGNMSVMADVLEISENDFFEQSGADRDSILQMIRDDKERRTLC